MHMTFETIVRLYCSY